MELKNLKKLKINGIYKKLYSWNEVKKSLLFLAEVLNYKDASGVNPLDELATFSISQLVLS